MKCLEEVLGCFYGVKSQEKTDLNNLDDFVDLFNEIPGFNDCNYFDAIDWLATDVNDLGY
jgi:hypothetical protein